jgi:hypothetical protein
MLKYEIPKVEFIPFEDEKIITGSACACGMYTSNQGMNEGEPGYGTCSATTADAEEYNYDVGEDEV